MRTSLTLGGLAVAMSICAAPASQAVTMTFDGLPALTSSYTENGIVLSDLNSSFVVNLGDGRLHLGDGGPDWFKGRFALSSGGTFSVSSFDIKPSGSAFCAAGSATCNDPFDNVLIQGFLGASLVAEAKFWMGTSLSTYFASSLFSNIDAFVIAVAGPTVPGRCLDAPCSHFSIDNLNLSPSVTPVPVPAPIALLGSALGLLGAGSRLRRHRRAK